MTANAPNADSDLQPSDPRTPKDTLKTQPVPADEAEIQALKAELHQTRLDYQRAIEMAQFQAGFLARAAHELRSPINSVIGLHQLILSDLCDSPEEEREFVAQAYDAAQRMLGLMDEVIHVSQLVQKTSSLTIAAVSLYDLLATVEQATHLQAKNRSLQLEIHYPDPSVTVLADERRLKQVLLHLVDMPLSLMQEGFIRVTTQILPETVQIEIADQRPAACWQESIDQLAALKAESSHSGPSIDRENTLQALSRSPIPPSLGLRLLTQRSVLELMGGQLTLLETPVQSSEAAPDSKPSQGITRIRCTLPLAAGF